MERLCYDFLVNSTPLSPSVKNKYLGDNSHKQMTQIKIRTFLKTDFLQLLSFTMSLLFLNVPQKNTTLTNAKIAIISDPI